MEQNNWWFLNVAQAKLSSTYKSNIDRIKPEKTMMLTFKASKDPFRPYQRKQTPIEKIWIFRWYSSLDTRGAVALRHCPLKGCRTDSTKIHLKKFTISIFDKAKSCRLWLRRTIKASSLREMWACTWRNSNNNYTHAFLANQDFSAWVEIKVFISKNLLKRKSCQLSVWRISSRWFWRNRSFNIEFCRYKNCLAWNFQGRNNINDFSKDTSTSRQLSVGALTK